MAPSKNTHKHGKRYNYFASVDVHAVMRTTLRATTETPRRQAATAERPQGHKPIKQIRRLQLVRWRCRYPPRSLALFGAANKSPGGAIERGRPWPPPKSCGNISTPCAGAEAHGPAHRCKASLARPRAWAEFSTPKFLVRHNTDQNESMGSIQASHLLTSSRLLGRDKGELHQALLVPSNHQLAQPTDDNCSSR